MGKFLLTDGYVSITYLGTSYDFSNYAHTLDTPSTKEQVDVSGFNSTSSKEFLPGPRDDAVSIGFRQNFSGGTSAVHAVLWAIYSSGGTFQFDLRSVSPSTNSTVSVTNPAYRGTASLFEYNGLTGELSAVADLSVTAKPAPNTFFNWQTT